MKIDVCLKHACILWSSLICGTDRVHCFLRACHSMPSNVIKTRRFLLLYSRPEPDHIVSGTQLKSCFSPQLVLMSALSQCVSQRPLFCVYVEETWDGCSLFARIFMPKSEADNVLCLVPACAFFFSLPSNHAWGICTSSGCQLLTTVSYLNRLHSF